MQPALSKTLPVQPVPVGKATSRYTAKCLCRDAPRRSRLQVCQVSDGSSSAFVALAAVAVIRINKPRSLRTRRNCRQHGIADGMGTTADGRGSRDDVEAVLRTISATCVPVWPPDSAVRGRLRVLHTDPAVLLLPDFWPKEACEGLIDVARKSNAMVQSGCSVDGSPVSGFRTSSSLVLKPLLLQKCGPSAEDYARKLHRDLFRLLGVGAGLPAGMLTGEYPQLVRYEAGQKFDPHEDAFSMREARRSNYQRRVTLLVYLNDVARGGSTRFGQLGIDVQPKCGSALIFFPASADSRPDDRTQHEAEAAIDEKWIAQVWAGSSLGQLME